MKVMQQIRFLSHEGVDSNYELALATDVNLPERVRLIPFSHSSSVLLQMTKCIRYSFSSVFPPFVLMKECPRDSLLDNEILSKESEVEGGGKGAHLEEWDASRYVLEEKTGC